MCTRPQVQANGRAKATCTHRKPTLVKLPDVLSVVPRTWHPREPSKAPLFTYYVYRAEAAGAVAQRQEECMATWCYFDSLWSMVMAG